MGDGARAANGWCSARSTSRANAFESPAKHAEIVALLSAYERFLNDQRRADMAAVYQEALRHRDWCPIQPQDCWTELPDANWNPLQRALLDGLPGERLEPRTLRASWRVNASPTDVARARSD